MLNNLIIEGRLTRDPEIKKTPTGLAITNITIACEAPMRRNGETRTLYLPTRFFGSAAENVKKYFSSGRIIIAIGRLEMDNYIDKNTNEQKTMYFMAADRFEFPAYGKPKNESEVAPPIEGAAMEGNSQERFAPSSPDVADDVTDDLPF